VTSLALVGALGLATTAYVALRTSTGLRLDPKVLDAVSSTGLAQVDLHVKLRSVTHKMIALLLVILLACAVLALVRRRFDLALGTLIVIGGASLTTHFLQDVFTRPNLSSGANGLPSQHMTIALSIALAAVMLAPPAWRSIVALAVSASASLVGVALVLGRWHRLSDIIAATSVCLVWAAIGLLAAGVVRRRPSNPARSVPALVGALMVAWTVSLVLAWWGARPQPGLPDLGLTIISLASIGLACVLSTAAVTRVADRHLG